MTGRVGVDVLAVEFPCSEGQYAGPGRGHVFDHDVQVDLLGHGWIRPGGRAVIRGELKGQA